MRNSGKIIYSTKIRKARQIQKVLARKKIWNRQQKPKKNYSRRPICSPFCVVLWWRFVCPALTLSCLGAYLVHVFPLPAHISSDNGLIGMINLGKVFVGVLAMHFHT
jgi:hypothetical protein